jgi:hypothetical protein
MADIVFHRTELAEQMVKGIMASAVGSASASGLFLAAPRRTGKSTFVREDLRPALQRYGATVLYVDLWANKQADPGAVIVGAVRAELAQARGHRRPAGQSGRHGEGHCRGSSVLA